MPTPIPKLTVLEKSLQDLRPLAWRSLAYSTAVSLLVLAPFYFMLEVYGRVIDSRSLSTLGWLLLMLVFMLALMQALDWLRKEWLNLAANESDGLFSDAVYIALQQRTYSTGQLPVLAPFQDLKILRDTWKSPAILALLELPASFVFLGLLYSIHPLLVAAALAGIGLFVALRLLQHHYNQRDLDAAQQTLRQSDRMLQDFVENRQSATAMGMAPTLFARWTDVRLQGLIHWTQASDSAVVFNALNRGLNLVFSSGLLGLSAYLLISANLPSGAAGMILASTLGGRLLAPLGVLITNGKTLTQAQQAWRRIYKLLQQHAPTSPAMALPKPKGELELQNFSLTYPGQKSPALRGIHFKLSPGQLMLVVGPSGSGKSTLARALIGLLPSHHGSARLDGAELFDWLPNGLGQHCGYLPQSIDIHEGTLAQNITRFTQEQDSSNTSTPLETAIQEWQLSHIIDQSPQGLQTMLREGCHTLSGGEIQKIGLARAYFGNPSYVVLDEPDSALDDAGFALLMQQLSKYKQQGTTQIVITHRLSLSQIADKVLVLQNGAQQAFGEASSLIEKKAGHAHI